MRNTLVRNSVPKLDLFTYVSLNNPTGTKELAKQSGYKQMPANAIQGALVLSDIADKEGDIGMEKIAAIHPDRELILSSLRQNPVYTPTNPTIEPVNKAATILYADANTTKKGLSEKTLNIVIISTAVVLGLGVIAMISNK